MSWTGSVSVFQFLGSDQSLVISSFSTSLVLTLLLSFSHPVDVDVLRRDRQARFQLLNLFQDQGHVLIEELATSQSSMKIHHFPKFFQGKSDEKHTKTHHLDNNSFLNLNSLIAFQGGFDYLFNIPFSYQKITACQIGNFFWWRNFGATERL